MPRRQLAPMRVAGLATNAIAGRTAGACLSWIPVQYDRDAQIALFRDVLRALEGM